jgi:hypothetical protein
MSFGAGNCVVLLAGCRGVLPGLTIDRPRQKRRTTGTEQEQLSKHSIGPSIAEVGEYAAADNVGDAIDCSTMNLLVKCHW